MWKTSDMQSVQQGIEAKVGASMACAISSMEGLSKRKARILARQCGSMLAGRPARRRCGGAKSTWSDAATRQSALREAEQGMRASWTERAEQLSIDREVSAHSPIRYALTARPLACVQRVSKQEIHLRKL